MYTCRAAASRVLACQRRRYALFAIYLLYDEFALAIPSRISVGVLMIIINISPEVAASIVNMRHRAHRGCRR